MERLSRDAILSALKSLSDELARTGESAELVVAGGAAIVLLFDARESTKDVDAVVASGATTESVRRAASRVAESLSLPPDWLNDGAKGYMQGLSPGQVVFAAPALCVRALALPQLLAMKLSAWRDDVDISDARVLLRNLPGARDQIWESLERFLVPGRELKARYAFDDAWEAEHGVA